MTFEEIMALPGKVYKQKPGRETIKVIVEGKDCFIKKHYGVGWKEIFKNLLQGKKPIVSARNEWQAIEYLTKAGIGTMSLVGYGEKGLNPARLRSFVITESLEHTKTLEELLKNKQINKRLLIKQLAELTRRLHAIGIAHRDYYLCHIRMDAEGQLYIMDLHRALIFKSIPERWLVKDLGALYFSSMNLGFSKRDYFRFIKIYSQQSLRENLINRKGFWEKVKVRAKHF